MVYFLVFQVTVTISNPPANLTSTTDPNTLTQTQLENISQQFINTYQLGTLGTQLNLNIISFQIIEPMPATGTPTWTAFATLDQSAVSDIQVWFICSIVQCYLYMDVLYECSS